EPLREAERLRDAARLLLVGIEEPVDAMLMPVAEQAEELPRMSAACDQHQLVDPGIDECLDREVDHRPIVNRQQMLVGNPRERVEPGAGAAGENDALHRGADASGLPPGGPQS